MIPAARQPLLLAVTPLVLLMAVPLPAAKAVLPLVAKAVPAAKAVLPLVAKVVPAVKAVLPLVERWEALPARDKRWVVTTTMVAVAGETE